MKHLFIILFVFWSPLALAFQKVLPADSMLQAIEKMEGVARAAAYYDAVYYWLRSDPQIATRFIDASAKYAASQDNLAITAYSLLNRGIYFSAKGVPDSAIYFLEDANKSAAKSGNREVMIKINSSLGKAYISDGNPETALKNLFEALRILRDHPHVETEIKVRSNVCWAYLELKRYQDCVNYGRQSLPLMNTPDFEWMSAYFYNNMAAAYGALMRIDSAKYFAEKSIVVSAKTNQYNLLANAHFILGTAYANSGKYALAAREFESAKPYREKIGDVLFLVSDLYVLADLYYKMGDYKKGIAAGQESLELIQKNNLRLKYEGAYQALARNYEGLKDYKSASTYYNLLAAARDSVYKHATSQAIAEMQEKYETEKKNRQISDLNKDNLLKTATIERNYFLIGGLTALLLLVIVLFYMIRYRSRQQQLTILNEQKMRMREAQITAVIDSQEKERRRFASDLHDGMGQLISALQLNIQSMKQSQPTPESRDVFFESSEQLIREIHDEIRNIAFNLMPPVLVKEGLIAATSELIRKINKVGKIKATISVFDVNERFSEIAEISLYRVIQEFLSNIMKYSHATEVNISFTGHEHEVVMTIDDNGIGYNLENFKHSEGNGWRNINSRLNLIKAAIEWDVVEGRKNNTIIISTPMSSLRNANTNNPLVQNTDQWV